MELVPGPAYQEVTGAGAGVGSARLSSAVLATSSSQPRCQGSENQIWKRTRSRDSGLLSWLPPLVFSFP